MLLFFCCLGGPLKYLKIFKICLFFFFFEGVGKNWNHFFLVMVMSMTVLQMWLSVYVLHCVTVRCFFIILTLVLFWFGSCICCSNLILALLWNGFFCERSRDNCCHTIKGISQKPVLSLLSLQICGSRQKLWAELSQDMSDISKHLSVPSEARRAENALGATKHSNTCQLGFTSFLQSEISQITLPRF